MCTAKFFTINQEVRHELHALTANTQKMFISTVTAWQPLLTACSARMYRLKLTVWASCYTQCHAPLHVQVSLCPSQKLICDFIYRLHTPSPSWLLLLYVTQRFFPSTQNWASKMHKTSDHWNHLVHFHLCTCANVRCRKIHIFLFSLAFKSCTPDIVMAPFTNNEGRGLISTYLCACAPLP